MALDKKVARSRVRFVLPTALGSVGLFDDVPPQLVHGAWDSIRS